MSPPPVPTDLADATRDRAGPSHRRPGWAAAHVEAPGPAATTTELLVPIVVGWDGVAALVPVDHPVVAGIWRAGRARLLVQQADDERPARIEVTGAARVTTHDVAVVHDRLCALAQAEDRPGARILLLPPAADAVVLHVRPLTIAMHRQAQQLPAG